MSKDLGLRYHVYDVLIHMEVIVIKIMQNSYVRIMIIFYLLAMAPTHEPTGVYVCYYNEKIRTVSALSK